MKNILLAKRRLTAYVLLFRPLDVFDSLEHLTMKSLQVYYAHRGVLNGPIVADELYGVKSNRLYLHTEYLVFTHPVERIIRLEKIVEF